LRSVSNSVVMSLISRRYAKIGRQIVLVQTYKRNSL
jgi:hypothetical protein